MKISKLFHWLYFIVMMLPIMVAPIFAIYCHRHTIDSYSVIREEPNYVNAFQYVHNGKPSSLDTYSLTSGSSLVYLNGLTAISFASDYFDVSDYGCYLSSNGLGDFVIGHDLFFKISIYVDNINDTNFSLYFGLSDDYAFEDMTISYIHEYFYTDFYGSLISDSGESSLFGNVGFSFSSISYFEVYLKDFMVFDLTDIFGSGNEPTAEVFNSYLSQDYYDYGNNVLNVGTHNVIYNDTDIGSQFIYDIYNCVDKYFNYDKVVNFGDLYSWLNTTFFSGNASLGFFIFWHLLIYWLLTSLLWLLFDVLMYVPMLVHRWLDKASLS